MGWEIGGRLEFEEALRELDAKGVTWTLATPAELAERGVSAMAHFLDPAGYRHELIYGQEFEPCSFIPGRPISGFVADELGLGHVVLGVPEVTDELRAFATEVLGFQIFTGYRTLGADGHILGLEFYRCNPRSHCMAYIPTAGHRGVTHMCIETHSLDDVGRAYDLVLERGIPLKLTLGRHTMDTLVSFYIRTPSGFEFEYGAGGVMIDDETFVAQKPRRVSVWGHKMLLQGWGSTVKPVADPSVSDLQR
jgi:extradiol dioxygenase